MTYPQYPQAPGFPAPAYPTQPAAPQYPTQYPQGQAYPAPASAAAPPPATGSLDSFFSQPSGAGGPSLKFNGKPNGTAYIGRVARTITNGDIRQQTDQSGRPVTFKDGRPKWILVVPLEGVLTAVNGQWVPSPDHPDGTGSWWCKGQARDELVRAMTEAGVPADQIARGPEKGALIQITKSGERQIPNMNAQYLYEVRYTRPEGAEDTQQAAPVVEAAEPAAQGTSAAPPEPAPPAAPDGLSDDQKQLLARLTGQIPG